MYVLKPFFRNSSITELKRSGLSMARKLNRTATLWNSFKSSPSRRLLSSPTSGEPCHFAVLRSSLIWLALGPPTSSISGFATSEASVNPNTCNARETCCKPSSYSIHRCSNVSVLPKKLTVRDCDDSGPRVTTWLNSYAPRNKLNLCSRSSHRTTMKIHRHAPESRFASLCGRSGTEKPHLGKILPPPNPEHCVLPNVGQHPKNHTSSLALSHTRLAAFPWDFRLAIGRGCRDLHLREVCSTHICNGDQERVLILKRLPDTQC